MNLLDSEQYYSDLYRAIVGAKQRIVLISMVMYADDKTMPIFEQIAEAANRGVAVKLYVDSGFRHMLIGSYPYSPRKHKQLLGRTLDIFTRLSSLGVKIVELKKVNLNPFKGRCHVKASIVDDEVFSFGGINFCAHDFKNLDYMLYQTNSSLAENLLKILSKLEKSKTGDILINIDNKNTILLDAGNAGQSIIYDKACLLAEQASKIYYVSQMVPSGKLARAIKATNSECYFNRISQGKGAIVLSLALDKIQAQIQNQYKRDGYVHAKFILFKMKDGSRALISGSHNFSWRGVAYGTQEIAIYSTDEDLWGQLYDFIKYKIM